MIENRGSSLISDIISCIIDVRKKKQYINLPFESDLSDTISALLILESHFERYEELSLIRKLKTILLNYLMISSDYVYELNNHLQIDSFSTSMGIKRKIAERNLIQQSDIEPLKKQILAEIVETIIVLTDEEIINSFNTSQKKMKANHNFLLDLDSYPLLEPLENTLAILRRESDNSGALKKLFFMDVEDFIDHPQWLELIELLKRSLLTNSIFAVHIVVKFATQLSKHQGIDALRLLAHYFYNLFCTSAVNVESISEFNELSSITHLTDVQKVQIGALLLCLSSLSKHGLSGSELDEIIFILFFILAEGKFIVKISGVDLSVKVFDIMVDLNKEFSFVKQLCISFVPLSIVYHAKSSRLIFKLISHIRELGHSSELNCFSNNCQTYPRRLLISSIMFLELLSPFASNGYVKQICCDDKNESNVELVSKSIADIKFNAIKNKIMKVLNDSKTLFDNNKIFVGFSDPCPTFDIYFSNIVTVFMQSIHQLLLEANVYLVKTLIMLTMKFLPYTTIVIRKYVFESYSKIFQEVIDLRAQELLYFPLLDALMNYFTLDLCSSDDFNGLFHLVKLLSDWYLLSYSSKDMLEIKNLLTLQTYLTRFCANNDCNKELVNDFVAPAVSGMLTYLLSNDLVDSTIENGCDHIFIMSVLEYELLADLVTTILDPMIQNFFSRLLIQHLHNNCGGNNTLDIMHKLIKSKKCSNLLSDSAFETLQLYLNNSIELSRIEFCIVDSRLLDVLRIIYEIRLVDSSGNINKCFCKNFNSEDMICDPDLLLKSIFLNEVII